MRGMVKVCLCVGRAHVSSERLVRLRLQEKARRMQKRKQPRRARRGMEKAVAKRVEDEVAKRRMVVASEDARVEKLGAEDGYSWTSAFSSHPPGLLCTSSQGRDEKDEPSEHNQVSTLQGSGAGRSALRLLRLNTHLSDLTPQSTVHKHDERVDLVIQKTHDIQGSRVFPGGGFAGSSLVSSPISTDSKLRDTLNYVDRAMPFIIVELEDEATTIVPISPIQRYRRRTGILYVTDLSELAWCEVKYDYDLRPKRVQRREKENRSVASWRAKRAREVSVQQDVAAKNYEASQIGQVLLLNTFVKEIHRGLELEDEPEPIEVLRVAPYVPEKFSPRSYILTRYIQREMHVFGIVQGAVVVRRIDEIEIISDDFMPESGTERASSPYFSAPSQRIRIIDTKTRCGHSVPSDENARPAQLQLMIYYLIFSRLLDTSAPFKFNVLWTRLGVSPSAPFSPGYVEQAGHIRGFPESVPLCLADVVHLLQTRLPKLDLPPLDDMLRLIYRSQKGYKYSRCGSPNGEGREDMAYIIPPTFREDHELSAAIEFTKAIERSSQSSSRKKMIDLLTGGYRMYKRRSPPPPTAKTGAIMGTKDFAMDDARLNAFLRRALVWWRGDRAAKGVPLHQAGRCNSCEYQMGCKWREKKRQDIEYWRKYQLRANLDAQGHLNRVPTAVPISAALSDAKYILPTIPQDSAKHHLSTRSAPRSRGADVAQVFAEGDDRCCMHPSHAQARASDVARVSKNDLRQSLHSPATPGVVSASPWPVTAKAARQPTAPKRSNIRPHASTMPSGLDMHTVAVFRIRRRAELVALFQHPCSIMRICPCTVIVALAHQYHQRRRLWTPSAFARTRFPFPVTRRSCSLHPPVGAEEGGPRKEDTRGMQRLGSKRKKR
ncbi:exonuclease V [Mycena sanguinolenta]|nr:exonuclease V [Mycena sanguinolenta]